MKRAWLLAAAGVLLVSGLVIRDRVIGHRTRVAQYSEKVSSGRVNLREIRDLQIACYADRGLFVGNVAPTPIPDRRGHPEGVPWDPSTRFSILGFVPEGNVSCSYALEGPDWSTDGFTARAECDLDGDGKVTTYWVTAADTEARAGTVR